MVATPIECIVEEGIDPSKFVKGAWSDDIRTTPIQVVVGDEVLLLNPALKIQEGVAPNKITQAFDVIEAEFLDACKKKKDPEKEYLKIIKSYPHRIAISEEFVDLASSKYLPKSRFAKSEFGIISTYFGNF